MLVFVKDFKVACWTVVFNLHEGMTRTDGLMLFHLVGGVRSLGVLELTSLAAVFVEQEAGTSWNWTNHSLCRHDVHTSHCTS